MQPDDLKHKAIRSIFALTGRTLLLQLVNGVALLMLGIFLSPSTIGVYIVVSAVIRIFNLFTDVGLGAALIQKKEDLDREDLKVAFTLQEILVVTAVALGFSLTPFVRQHAGLDSAGIWLYWSLLATLFISSLKVIPSILLERRLAFEKQVLPQIVEAFVFNVVIVYCAWKGFGVMSYTWAILSSALIGLPIYYLVSPWKISLGFSKEKAKMLFSYGVQFQGKSVLAVIKDDLLTFFMSGIVGTSGVGYWGTAQRWAYFPYRFLVDSITKVTFPAYSRVQEDFSALRSGIEKSLFLVSLVLFPVLTGMMMLVDQLIQIIPKYAKWEPALPSFYFLCAQAGMAALTNILINVLDATGRVRTTLILMVFWIVSTWGATLLLVWKFGFTGIAAAQFLVAFSLILVVYLTQRVVKFSFAAQVVKPLLGVVLMAGFILMIKLLSPQPSLIKVVLTGGIGGLVYIIVMMLLAKKEILTNATIILKAFKRT